MRGVLWCAVLFGPVWSGVGGRFRVIGELWLSMCFEYFGQMGMVRVCSVDGVLWWLRGCGFDVLKQCSIDWDWRQETLGAELGFQGQGACVGGVGWGGAPALH